MTSRDPGLEHDPLHTGCEAGPLFDGVQASWADAAGKIISTCRHRVLVIGEVDAGKSTFCHLLLHAALETGRRAELLDTDLGQKMIGPPACVTLGQADRDAGLVLSGLAFVGTTDPVRGWRGLIDGAARLAPDSRADLLVVNTSGLLAGPGLRLKSEKIQALAPDYMVSIGESPVFDALLGRRPELPGIRLSASVGARRKPKGERRRARREAFRTYFADAQEAILPLIHISMDRAMGATAELSVRRLVGFSDLSGRDLGLGIVTSIGPDAQTITVLTPVSLTAAARIRWGMLRVEQDFSEGSG